MNKTLREPVSFTTTVLHHAEYERDVGDIRLDASGRGSIIAWTSKGTPREVVRAVDAEDLANLVLDQLLVALGNLDPADRLATMSSLAAALIQYEYNHERAGEQR